MQEDRKKYGIWSGPPLRRLLEERAGAARTPTGVVNAVADRYLEMVRRSAPTLAVAEWAVALEALRRRPPAKETAVALARLWDGIEDDLDAAIRAAGRHPADTGSSAPPPDLSGVDGAGLAAKLRRLSYPETVAVVDVAERFWSRFDPADSLFALSHPVIAAALTVLGARVSP